MTFVISMKLLKQGKIFRYYPRFENEESIDNFLQVCKISKKYAESTKMKSTLKRLKDADKVSETLKGSMFFLRSTQNLQKVFLSALALHS